MFSPPTPPRTRPRRAALFAAGVLIAAAGFAHTQAPPRFAFASQSHARAVLGELDTYVRATAALERSVKLRTSEAVDEDRFASALAATALAWTDDEQRALSEVLRGLASFIATMRWQAPSTIFIVKASDRLLEGLPHTRGTAIVLQQGVLRQALRDAALLTYLLSHEAFHGLSRNNPALREELYAAIGFQACSSLDMPSTLANLRVTNPDAPENRHTIVLRHGGQMLEMLPFVHFRSDAIDPSAGFPAQTRTSWLHVTRQQGRCTVAGQSTQVDLEAVFERIGRNTNYYIHPEEILADNFALLFRRPQSVASPGVLERIEKILRR